MDTSEAYGVIFRELGNLIMQAVHSHGRDAVKEVLSEYGATKLQDLPLGNVRGFYERIVSLLATPNPEKLAETYAATRSVFQAKTFGEAVRDAYLAGYKAGEDA